MSLLHVIIPAGGSLNVLLPDDGFGWPRVGSGCRAKLFLLLVLPAALGTQFAAL